MPLRKGIPILVLIFLQKSLEVQELISTFAIGCR